MANWQGKSKRKTTGGRRIFARSKRKFEIGAEKQATIIGDATRNKKGRTRGGNEKVRLMTATEVNVLNPKDNLTKKTKVLSVVENPADPHYVQRNIINKGAIIKTELGNAKVTSRPGQVGILNAVLVE